MANDNKEVVTSTSFLTRTVGQFYYDSCGVCGGTAYSGCNYNMFSSYTPKPPTFASYYTAASLLKKPVQRYKFLYDLLHYEGKFIQKGVSFDLNTGLNFDGHPINPISLDIDSIPRNWSSPSKEVCSCLIFCLFSFLF